MLAPISATSLGKMMEKAFLVPQDELMEALKLFAPDDILCSAAGLSVFGASTNLHLR
jgi:hypothetical protein